MSPILRIIMEGVLILWIGAVAFVGISMVTCLVLDWNQKRRRRHQARAARRVKEELYRENLRRI